MGKRRCFYGNLDRISLVLVQPHPGHVVASLDKTLYGDYLLRGGLEQATNSVTRIRRNLQKHWIIGNS